MLRFVADNDECKLPRLACAGMLKPHNSNLFYFVSVMIAMDVFTETSAVIYDYEACATFAT